MIEGKRVVAVIQARMTSTRLPGKIMLPLAGKPVMQHMIERHRRSKFTDEVIVATTANLEDDIVEELCKKLGCACFRGSEEDVLGRVVSAGEYCGADILVQGMADSPLVDWRLIDRCVELLVKESADCASNEFVETYPIGFDVRAYAFPTLRATAQTDQDPVYREHAGYSIRTAPQKYTLVNWEAQGELRWPALRLTLDFPEDYTLIAAVFEALYPRNPDFSATDVVAFLRKRPDLVAVNINEKQYVPDIPLSDASA